MTSVLRTDQVPASTEEKPSVLHRRHRFTLDFNAPLTLGSLDVMSHEEGGIRFVIANHDPSDEWGQYGRSLPGVSLHGRTIGVVGVHVFNHEPYSSLEIVTRFDDFVI